MSGDSELLMNRIFMLGIATILIGGIVLNFSLNHYRTYVELEKIVMKKSSDDNRCDGDVCDTSYQRVPDAFLRDSRILLGGGLMLFSFGSSILVIKRQEIA